MQNFFYMFLTSPITQDIGDREVGKKSFFMRRISAIIAIISIYCLPSPAQEAKAWEEIYSCLAYTDDIDADSWESAFETLSTLALSPQNINEATLSDLTEIPFITEKQGEEILRYRRMYGDIVSLAELSLIPSLDSPRQRILQMLFFAAPSEKKNELESLLPDSTMKALRDSIRGSYEAKGRGGRKVSEKHSLFFSIGIPTYKREGYRDSTYLGKPYSHTLRYTFNSSHLQAALTAAQDAGEEFFSGANRKGWDFYTGYVRLKNYGCLKNAVFGHFQVSMGMGLVMNNYWRLSRSSLLSSNPKALTAVRGHSSRQSSNYLQGAAATLAFPLGSKECQLVVTPFFAIQQVDAIITPSGTIQSIQTTGYHRTPTEVSRRNSSSQTVVGGSLGLSSKAFSVSCNIVHAIYPDSLTPKKSELYRYYYPSGKSFTTMSLAYSFKNKQWNFCGETALSKAAEKPKPANANLSSASSGSNGERGITIATANSLRYSINSHWKAFMLYRYYSYSFSSPFANSFGDMSNAQNESGLYLGTSTTAIPRLTLSAYVDAAYHPWARYRYKTPSRSFDANLLASYHRGSLSAIMRYRYREQQQTASASFFPAFNTVNGASQHNLSMTLKYSNGRWSASSQTQCAVVPQQKGYSDSVSSVSNDNTPISVSNHGNSVGFATLLGGGYSERNIAVWLSAAYFNTPNYDSRLYLTDRALSFGQLSSMVYDHGFRAALLVEYSPLERVKASASCSSLHYFSKSTISSGPQLINSSSQTDIRLQISYSF